MNADASIEQICETVKRLVGRDRYLWTGRKWLRFDGLKWVATFHGVRDVLSTELHDFYEALRSPATTEVVDEVQFKLKHTVFKDAIAGKCKDHYHTSVFVLDNKVADQVCFSNGVYRIKDGCFRPDSDPDEYITVWFELPFDPERVAMDTVFAMVELQTMYVAKRGQAQCYQRSDRRPNRE